MPDKDFAPVARKSERKFRLMRERAELARNEATKAAARFERIARHEPGLRAAQAALGDFSRRMAQIIGQLEEASRAMNQHAQALEAAGREAAGGVEAPKTGQAAGVSSASERFL